VVVAVAIVLVVTVAGIGAYQYYQTHTGPAPLVIYTYPGLLGSVSCGGEPLGGILSNFSDAYHVPVEVECPSGTLVETLEEQASSPSADLVIGLDELTAPQAENLGLLIPYTSPQLASINSSVVEYLSPGHYVTPYEYGFLGIDYTNAFFNSTGGAIASSSLVNLTTNRTWARALAYEDPLSDITGEEFLAWTVEFYEHVLHEDWTNFWRAIQSYGATDAGSWSTAFNTDFVDLGSNPLVVSYTTDPASAVYYGEGNFFNTTVSAWAQALYSWETIYGIGIVAGTHHLTLDQQFINYFLNGTVQLEIPLNEWEYPANETVRLPPIYAPLIPPSSITPLNEFTVGETPSEIASNLTDWQTTWENLGGT
jgi:thiamine transport system substrate-binding protein